MNITHHQLFDPTVRFNSQAALDIASKYANAVLVVGLEYEANSVQDIAGMVDTLLENSILNKTSTCAMGSASDNDMAKGFIQIKFIKSFLRTFRAIADCILFQHVWYY